MQMDIIFLGSKGEQAVRELQRHRVVLHYLLSRMLRLIVSHYGPPDLRLTDHL
jgi:hypothetical protein